jgi:hypothetical protein
MSMERLDERTPSKPITRKELYEKFPYLKNISAKEMIQLVSMCFQTNSDGDLIYAIKCYLHSYPELRKQENFEKVYKESE